MQARLKRDLLFVCVCVCVCVCVSCVCAWTNQTAIPAQGQCYIDHIPIIILLPSAEDGRAREIWTQQFKCKHTHTNTHTHTHTHTQTHMHSLSLSSLNPQIHFPFASIPPSSALSSLLIFSGLLYFCLPLLLSSLVYRPLLIWTFFCFGAVGDQPVPPKYSNSSRWQWALTEAGAHVMLSQWLAQEWEEQRNWKNK